MSYKYCVTHDRLNELTKIKSQTGLTIARLIGYSVDLLIRSYQSDSQFRERLLDLLREPLAKE